MKGLFIRKKYEAVITGLDHILELRDMDYLVELVTRKRNACYLWCSEYSKNGIFILKYKARSSEQKRIEDLFDIKKKSNPGMTITYLSK